MEEKEDEGVEEEGGSERSGASPPTHSCPSTCINGLDNADEGKAVEADSRGTNENERDERGFRSLSIVWAGKEWDASGTTVWSFTAVLWTFFPRASATATVGDPFHPIARPPPIAGGSVPSLSAFSTLGGGDVGAPFCLPFPIQL